MCPLGGKVKVERGRERQWSLVQLSHFAFWSPLGLFEVCVLTCRPTALTSTHEFRLTMLAIVTKWMEHKRFKEGCWESESAREKVEICFMKTLHFVFFSFSWYQLMKIYHFKIHLILWNVAKTMAGCDMQHAAFHMQKYSTWPCFLGFFFSWKQTGFDLGYCISKTDNASCF